MKWPFYRVFDEYEDEVGQLIIQRANHKIAWIEERCGKKGKQ